MATESRRGDVRGWGQGDGQLLMKGDRVSVWEDEKGQETGGGDGCTTM